MLGAFFGGPGAAVVGGPERGVKYRIECSYQAGPFETVCEAQEIAF